MKPLLVLLAAFGIALLAIPAITGQADHALAGTIAMSAMPCFTALGHIVFPEGHGADAAAGRPVPRAAGPAHRPAAAAGLLILDCAMGRPCC